jgi:hypothetical protein
MVLPDENARYGKRSDATSRMDPAEGSSVSIADTPRQKRFPRRF